ncbi:MAG: HEAT repeat domain-containing protein [Planctomycetota bacterium]
MEKLNLNSAPNPFSAFAEDDDRSKRSLRAAATLFGISVTLFCLLVAGQHLWKTHRLDQWLAQSDRRITDESLRDICRSCQLEPAAIGPVVRAIASENLETSRLGYDAIEAAKTNWVTLHTEQRQERRHTLAVALHDTASGLQAPPSDARHQRLLRLADAVVQDILAETNPSNSTSPLAPPDSETFDIAMRMVMRADESEDRLAQTPRLPTEQYVPAGDWTDWPPEPIAAPTLVRPQINSLAENPNVPQLLAQTAATAPVPASLGDVELGTLIAETLDDLPAPPSLSPQQLIDHWAAQLQSPSFRVRLFAINQLSKLGGPQVAEILQRHLPNETDPKVAHRIRRNLDLVNR